MNTASTTLKEHIYNDLFTAIVNGKYPVNTILTEKFLMDTYNVSRAPIREALMQLTGTSILCSIPRQGYKIISPNLTQIHNIVKFRTALEPAFLQIYHACITPDTINELHKLCKLFDACPINDFMTRWHYNCKFHLKLFSTYNNDYAYTSLENSLSIQTLFFVQSRHYASTSLHLTILDYLEKKDIDTAINILKADIGQFLLSTTSHNDNFS